MIAPNSSSTSRRKALAQVVVELGEEIVVGRDALQVAQLQPLGREVVHQRTRPLVAEHAPHLLLEHQRARADWPCAASASSSSSGMLLHRKNDRREASSMSLIAVGRPRRHLGGIALDAQHELRAGEDALQRQLDAGFEAAVLPRPVR